MGNTEGGGKVYNAGVKKIYTKTGDRGKTKTFLGEMSKADNLAEALGSVDELNSWLGLCRSLIFNLKFEILNQYSNLNAQLKNIQTNLLAIGSTLAGSVKNNKNLNVETRKLEKEIDRMTKELPRLTNFIYPVGDIQVARSVCRRAERVVVRFFSGTPFGFPPNLGGKNKGGILKYLNRLGDYLFVLARWVNWMNKIKEEIWRS